MLPLVTEDLDTFSSLMPSRFDVNRETYFTSVKPFEQ
jgi:hypothetical protein